LTADRVVIAAGSWAGQIDIEGVGERVPVRPVRGQLLHLGWDGPPLARVLWSDRCYMVPWEDGTLLVGATVEDAGFDERATAAGVRELIDAATDLVPGVASAAFLGARVGLRPGTPDGLPIIGRSLRLPHLMYATGHYRNGILLAPLTAELVADAILDDRLDPALSMTSPSRFGGL
jgi:glycine oxidase